MIGNVNSCVDGSIMVPELGRGLVAWVDRGLREEKRG